MQNSQTLQDYIFHILQQFATKLHNLTKFRKLFPTVLKFFSNLKVCIIGEWSIILYLFDARGWCKAANTPLHKCVDFKGEEQPEYPAGEMPLRQMSDQL